MQRMRAYRLLSWGVGGYAEVDVPDPGPGEVLLEVAGAGLCRSDVHFLDLPAGGYPASPPWTLGHENAGRVVARGPGCGRFADGDAVLVSGIHSCGWCEHCVRGFDNYCGQAITGRGAGIDGGLAPYLVVPERELVALDTDDPAQLAPLADAGHTSYSAVRRVLHKLRPGSTVVVIGIGGLGSYAVQYLRLLSDARVIAIDPSEQRLSFATELGAHVTLPPTAATPAHLAELTKGVGAAAVLDFVVDHTTLPLGFSAAAKLGTIVLVGLGGGSVTFAWGAVPPLGCDVVSIIGGSLGELGEIAALAQSGALRIEVERFAFDQIELALDRLREGSLLGRAVVLPNGAHAR